MGLFNKEKKEEKEDFPKLPELPRLPDLPRFDDEKGLPQLPSFPRNSFGEKFSQNTIKDAVSGRKEGDSFEKVDADEFAEEDEMENEQMMQKPSGRKLMSMESDENSDEDEFRQFQKFERKVMEAPSFSTPGNSYKKGEPIFIRLDKFEESLKIFEKTRNQISEIEDVLKEIKRIKEQEEKELMFWEQELQNMKKQIEKVDKDIFSRVE